MSSLKIEERFSVQAPIERVWSHLLNPEEIVICLPGAQLTEVENERLFHGQMKIKVGPVTVSYRGKIELVEVDEAARIIRMNGTGKEKGGAGSAKMNMTSTLKTAEDGACEVTVEADVQLAGRIVRFGRGMIQSVSAQLFKQFTGNVQTTLEQAVEESGNDGDIAAPSAGESPTSGGDTVAADTPEATAGAPSTGVDSSSQAGGPALQETAAADNPALSADDGPVESGSAASAAAADAASSARTGIAAGAAQQPRASAAVKSRQIAPREAEPVRALPLILRALWDVIAGLFRRLVGRGPK